MSYKTKEDLERVIALGKSEAVLDVFIASYLQGLEFEAWTEARIAEHKTLFPVKVDGGLDEEGDPILIDNPDYITYDVWMSEEVVTQAFAEAILDANGIVLVEEVKELTELVRVYTDVLVDVATFKTTSEVYASYIKANKVTVLDKMTVTTSLGNTFDADESSIVSMLSAIEAATFLVLTEHTWKLADNTSKLISIDELKEAHALAIMARGSVILG